MESLNKTTIKRINGDFKKFNEENPKYFDIYPDPNNILEIYFLLYGHEKTPYENGQYVCKIEHNPTYPLKAPDYYVLTPNGRFEVNKKICLTNSAYHQADWAPAAWNLITLIEGFSSIWHSDTNEDKVGISHIGNTDVKTLKKLASESIIYNTDKLSDIYTKFPKVKAGYSPY
jgi:ubiquitin-protein ligase